MAQQEVNQILEALKSGLQLRQHNQQLALEQERIDSENKHREAENKRYIDQLSEQKRQFDITAKAAQSLHDVQIAQAQQQAVAGAKQGIPIPGERVSDISSPGGSVGNFNIPQVPAGYQQHTLPASLGGSTVILPTLDTQAQQQASRERITSAPAEEVKTREQAALQDAETKRQLKTIEATHINRMAEQAKEQSFQAEQQSRSIAAQKSIAASNNAIHFRSAMATATGGLSEWGFGNKNPAGSVITTDESGIPTVQQGSTEDFIKNTLTQLRNGQLSSDELKKRYPKQAGVIQAVAASQGIGSLTKDEIGQLRDLETTAKIAPLIKDLVLLRSEHPIADMIPGTDAYKRYQQNLDLVGKSIPAIARVFSGVKRFNQQEFDKYMEGLLPKRSPIAGDTQAGVAKYNDFITKDLQSAFNTITGGLPKPHQDILREQIGLNSLPYLKQSIKQPGVNPPTPTGATPAIQPAGKPTVEQPKIVNPKQDKNGSYILPKGTNKNPGEIFVKRKSDGQLGFVPMKDFSLKLYEVQGYKEE